MTVASPAPDGPRPAVKRPLGMSTLTPPSAVTVVSPEPYTFVSSAVRAAAGAEVAAFWGGMVVLTSGPFTCAARARPRGSVHVTLVMGAPARHGAPRDVHPLLRRRAPGMSEWATFGAAGMAGRGQIGSTRRCRESILDP